MQELRKRGFGQGQQGQGEMDQLGRAGEAKEWSCCGSPAGCTSPSASASSSRTPPWRSPRARRRCCMRRRAHNSSSSGCARCSRRGAGVAGPLRGLLPGLPGRGPGAGVEEIRAINRFATGDLQPDRTLLLRISPATGRARQRARALDPDRLELEGEEFFARIAAAYGDLARAEPRRISSLDADAPPRCGVARRARRDRGPALTKAKVLPGAGAALHCRAP